MFVLKLISATCSVFRPGVKKFCSGERTKNALKRANLLNSKINTDNKILSVAKKYYQWQKNIISGKKILSMAKRGECLDFIFPLLEFHEHT